MCSLEDAACPSRPGLTADCHNLPPEADRSDLLDADAPQALLDEASFDLTNGWQRLFLGLWTPFANGLLGSNSTPHRPQCLTPLPTFANECQRSGSRLGARCSTSPNGNTSGAPGSGCIICIRLHGPWHTPSAELATARCKATDNTLHQRAQPWAAKARKEGWSVLDAKPGEGTEELLALVIPRTPHQNSCETKTQKQLVHGRRPPIGRSTRKLGVRSTFAFSTCRPVSPSPHQDEYYYDDDDDED